MEGSKVNQRDQGRGLCRIQARDTGGLDLDVGSEMRKK